MTFCLLLTCRVIVVFRWVYNGDDFEFICTKGIYPKQNATLIKLVLKMFKGRITSQASGQGMGRHTPEEVCTIARGDLTALSDFMGEYNPSMVASQLTIKRYFMSE